MMSDKTVEEISECSQGLDEAAKERILKLCEKKLGILENSEGSDKSEKEAEVKKYTAPKWHRTAFAAAACLLLVTGLVLINNNIKTPDPDTKNPVVTSQREETTETSVSQATENTETDKADTDYVEKYRKIVEEMVLKYEQIQNVLTGTGEKRAITDYSDEYSLNGMTYYKVSDPRFSTKQDIYAFVESVYPKTDVEEWYSINIEYNFLEKDRKLYVLQQEYRKEWLFDGWSDIPAEISDYGEDTFTAVKKYKMGDEQTGTIKFIFVRLNNEWRIVETIFDSDTRVDDYDTQVNREFIDHNFNLNVDKISAQDIYECSPPYKMPETINGCTYRVEDIFNKEKVYVTLILDGGEKQVGIYDFKNNSYSEIVNIRSNDLIMEYSDDYLIIRNNDDVEYLYNTPSLSYYDINKKTFGVIYKDMTSVYNGVQISNNVLLYNNVVYFDVCTRFETVSDKDFAVYKFDLLTGELTLVRENALIPVLIKDSVAALITNPKTGLEDTIQVIEGNDSYSYNVEKNIVGIDVTDNIVYESYWDKPWSSIIKNLESGEKILSQYPKSERSIQISDSNNNFIAFSDYSHEQIPCVYDMNQNKMVEFDNISEIFNKIYVKDDYGIISSFYYNTDIQYEGAPLTEKEIILFQPKND